MVRFNSVDHGIPWLVLVGSSPLPTKTAAGRCQSRLGLDRQGPGSYPLREGGTPLYKRYQKGGEPGVSTLDTKVLYVCATALHVIVHLYDLRFQVCGVAVWSQGSWILGYVRLPFPCAYWVIRCKMTKQTARERATLSGSLFPCLISSVIVTKKRSNFAVSTLGLVWKMSTRPNGGSFSAILFQFSLEYTKYSCVKLASSGEKISPHWAYF